MIVYSLATKPVAEKRLTAAQGGTPLWILGLAFLFGFCIQFNALVGGSGGGASAVGGYGFRLTDFLTVIAVGLLGLFGLVPRRFLALAAFTLFVGVVALFRILEPSYGEDPRTGILFLHYLGYSFAGLYIAVILTTAAAVDWFCWGLIIGLLLTVPIFVCQDLGYSSTLIQLGLAPQYNFWGALHYTTSNFTRHAGLWVHPNEASHVAALSAAAGAYFAFVHRRFVPLVLTAAGELAIFYYTQTRGGLFVSGLILGIPLVFASRRRINFLHLAVGLTAIVVVVLLLSQIDVVAYRFSNSYLEEQNITERLGSTLAALQLVLTNPFGMSELYFASVLEANAGVNTPHNGFIYFAAIFGIVPLFILVAAFVANLRSWRGPDAFFALFTLQVSLSFLFEQMPASYCYAMVTGLLMAHAYLKTSVGRGLVAQSAGVASRRPVSINWRKNRLVRGKPNLGA